MSSSSEASSVSAKSRKASKGSKKEDTIDSLMSKTKASASRSRCWRIVIDKHNEADIGLIEAANNNASNKAAKINFVYDKTTPINKTLTVYIYVSGGISRTTVRDYLRDTHDTYNYINTEQKEMKYAMEMFGKTQTAANTTNNANNVANNTVIAKLKAQNAKLKAKIDKIYTQLDKSNEVLEKYKNKTIEYAKKYNKLLESDVKPSGSKIKLKFIESLDDREEYQTDEDDEENEEIEITAETVIETTAASTKDEAKDEAKEPNTSSCLNVNDKIREIIKWVDAVKKPYSKLFYTTKPIDTSDDSFVKEIENPGPFLSMDGTMIPPHKMYKFYSGLHTLYIHYIDVEEFRKTNILANLKKTIKNDGDTMYDTLVKDIKKHSSRCVWIDLEPEYNENINDTFRHRLDFSCTYLSEYKNYDSRTAFNAGKEIIENEQRLAKIAEIKHETHKKQINEKQRQELIEEQKINKQDREQRKREREQRKQRREQEKQTKTNPTIEARKQKRNYEIQQYACPLPDECNINGVMCDQCQEFSDYLKDEEKKDEKILFDMHADEEREDWEQEDKDDDEERIESDGLDYKNYVCETENCTNLNTGEPTCADCKKWMALCKKYDREETDFMAFLMDLDQSLSEADERRCKKDLVFRKQMAAQSKARQQEQIAKQNAAISIEDRKKNKRIAERNAQIAERNARIKQIKDEISKLETKHEALEDQCTKADEAYDESFAKDMAAYNKSDTSTGEFKVMTDEEREGLKSKKTLARQAKLNKLTEQRDKTLSDIEALKQEMGRLSA